MLHLPLAALGLCSVALMMGAGGWLLSRRIDNAASWGLLSVLLAVGMLGTAGFDSGPARAAPTAAAVECERAPAQVFLTSDDASAGMP